MNRVFVLDNLDSFTFMLVDYLAQLGAEVAVERADRTSAERAMNSGFDAYVISPSPGEPRDARQALDLVRLCVAARKPLLGVCLGHQAIALHFGARVVRSERVMHGKISPVRHDRTGVFAKLPSPFLATRYHSLAINEASLSEPLAVNARGEDGSVQGIRHRKLPIQGVQFHPESIATQHGLDLLRGFLDLTSREARQRTAA